MIRLPKTTPNLPELKRLNMWVQEQDKIEPGARIWYQGQWVSIREVSPMCQTAYCVAGMAVVRAGHRVAEPDLNNWTVSLDGKRVSLARIPGMAEEILGIDSNQGGALFCGDNTAEDVDQAIRGIFTEAGVDYDSVEPAPDLEIEIKAAEAVRPQLLPGLEPVK
jgi:hypothetical protein